MFFYVFFKFLSFCGALNIALRSSFPLGMHHQPVVRLFAHQKYLIATPSFNLISVTLVLGVCKKE